MDIWPTATVAARPLFRISAAMTMDIAWPAQVYLNLVLERKKARLTSFI